MAGAGRNFPEIAAAGDWQPREFMEVYTAGANRRVLADDALDPGKVPDLFPQPGDEELDQLKTNDNCDPVVIPAGWIAMTLFQ